MSVLVQGWLLIEIEGVQAMLVLTGFLSFFSPTAGGNALGFLLLFSMPPAWRVVADAVAGGTAPIRMVGDSRPL